MAPSVTPTSATTNRKEQESTLPGIELDEFLDLGRLHECYCKGRTAAVVSGR